MLNGLHYQVQGPCGDYDPCFDGVYLDSQAGPDQPHAVRTTAIYKRDFGGDTIPPTDNIPDNILFIPSLVGGDLDATKLFREAHNSKAKPADKKRQVAVSFDPPPDETPLDVVLWNENVAGNSIVHVDLAAANRAPKYT